MRSNHPSSAPNPRPRTGPWRVLNRIVMLFIILALCAGGVMLFIPLVHRKQAGEERIAALQAQISRERAELARNNRILDLLRNDPEYIEVVARDRLDLMKPGEVIFRIESSADAKAPARAVPVGGAVPATPAVP